MNGKNGNRLAVVLLSGGMDSATLACYVTKQGYDEVAALTLDYGQKHSRELQSAARAAGYLGIPHRIVDVRFFKELAWFSALTTPQRFAVPQSGAGAGIPVTYVPLRNTFFIVLAAAYLESRVLEALEGRPRAGPVEAAIFLGANAVDFSGYPDCKPEYFEKIQQAVVAGSRIGAELGVPMQVLAPFKDMSKADIVRLGMELGAPFEHTWSCYQPGPKPCLKCDSCRLRQKGFAEAGFEDPLLERR